MTRKQLKSLLLGKGALTSRRSAVSMNISIFLPHLNTLPYEKIILRVSIDDITVCFCRLWR